MGADWKAEYLAGRNVEPPTRDGRHCTIQLDLDFLNIRARIRGNKLVLDVPDSALAALRRAVVAEVDGLIADLRRVQ